jgi:hypothetical protein
VNLNAALNAESMLNASTLACAHHASLDGKAWRMIRVFVLSDQTSRDRIGFEGHPPTGDGRGAAFDEIRFLPERLADPRTVPDIPGHHHNQRGRAATCCRVMSAEGFHAYASLNFAGSQG